ncbi:tautomerase family protein [Sphaerisporangium sp. NPDC049002]|uniref:tautomerase family protein n=1 Tax=unclassified Sphaerisporangium TaxID=2630420 RepID=UPI0033F5CF4E
MPHVNIKYFPQPLSDEQEAALVAAVSGAVRDALGCDEGVISIALEPVAAEEWDGLVYGPEIVGRKHLLRKTPNY